MNIINVIISLFVSLMIAITTSYAGSSNTSPQSIPTSELKGFTHYPPAVQKLINNALILTKQKLVYQYGSDNPKNGGMDCSGTIHYLIQSYNHNDIPRQSDQIYEWLVTKGKFHAVKTNSFSSAEFNQLQPGDLLFWTGTYAVKRKIPITHVMLYIGKNNQGEPLMFGASDGRTYKGRQIWGVSIFDFKLPQANSKSRFIGYGCIPNITC